MVFVERHATSEQLGDRLLGEIVRRWTEAAGRDHGTSSVERFANGLLNRSRFVADSRASYDVHPDRRQCAREVRSVCVDRESEQQLIADGDDFDRRSA
jgi:hypothetical protein